MKSEQYVTEETLKERTESWIINLDRKRNWRKPPRRTALLVLDMQRFFLYQEGHAYIPSGRAVLPHLRDFIEDFSGPTIFTRHIKGSPGNLMNEWWRGSIDGDLSEIVPELSPMVRTVIEKEHYSAFYGTELDGILSSERVDSVLITGVLTDLCCESTAREAFMRGYKVLFSADLTATATEMRHLSTLGIISNAFGEVVPSWEIR